MGFTIGEAAKRVGVHPDTLKRWMKAGKIPPVRRDRNGWFIFTVEDIARARNFYLRVIPPGKE